MYPTIGLYTAREFPSSAGYSSTGRQTGGIQHCVSPDVYAMALKILKKGKYSQVMNTGPIKAVGHAMLHLVCLHFHNSSK